MNTIINRWLVGTLRCMSTDADPEAGLYEPLLMLENSQAWKANDTS